MSDLKSILDKHEYLQSYLYSRGFCLTNRILPTRDYPFYGKWKMHNLGKFYVYIHPQKQISTLKVDDKEYFLIGHAYDPIDGILDEDELLSVFSSAADPWQVTNKWTGVFCVGFSDDETIHFTVDAAGQQLVYYGCMNETIYITSHCRLIQDFENIKQDSYISKLISFKYFHAFGLVLPGDLSPYSEFKRAQCNFCFSINTKGVVQKKRFWPTKPIIEVREDEINKTIHEIGEIVQKSLNAIANKWADQHIAISVTGGMDSKTTMACANGIYNRFSYFSYDSLPDEKVDCDAAHHLCECLGLEHTVYKIPYDDCDTQDVDAWDLILQYNCGNIGKCNRNDVRKRAFFAHTKPFDIEVKSWVDEIGRARYHKKYLKSSFHSNISARYLSSIYKPFLWQRILLHKTDKVFKQYLKDYYSDNIFELVPWWDIIYWEYEWNAAEGAFLTGDHLTPYDITIPFNNRMILEKMLMIPLKMRINDEIQKRIIQMYNFDIEKSGVNVVDVSHTTRRAKMERAYLEINTRLPF